MEENIKDKSCGKNAMKEKETSKECKKKKVGEISFFAMRM